MSPEDEFVCPCGVAAPVPLPRSGTRPVRCDACGTPLVRPGGIPRPDVERALGAALLVASLAAVGWMFAARLSGDGVHLLLTVGAISVALAAMAGARARGPAVQMSAGAAFVAFVLLGEVLLYRGALLPRLVELHRAEGAPDAQVLARHEHDAMDVLGYVHVEMTMSLFVYFGLGMVLALVLTRAPLAVEAFRRSPARPSAPEPPTVVFPDDGDEDATAWP